MKEEMPQNFPPLTVNIMRALCAIQLADGESQERLVKAFDVLYRKYWVDHSPIHEPETLRAALTDILGGGEADKGCIHIHPLPSTLPCLHTHTRSHSWAFKCSLPLPLQVSGRLLDICKGSRG